MQGWYKQFVLFKDLQFVLCVFWQCMLMCMHYQWLGFALFQIFKDTLQNHSFKVHKVTTTFFLFNIIRLLKCFQRIN